MIVRPRHASALVVFSVATLGSASLVGACKSDDDHCNTADDCHLGDDDLKACAGIATGIYGTARTCQPSRFGCDPRDPLFCSSVDITATPQGGTGGLQHIATDGRYSLTLSPGDYDVCCSGPSMSSQQCKSAQVVEGQLVRVDALYSVAAGGISCEMD